MIFPNNTYLIILVFLVINFIQYYRYRRIAGRDIGISGLLLFKILIRSFTLVLFILLARAYLKNSNNQVLSKSDATFVIKSYNPKSFTLPEDDRVNIKTRIPSNSVRQIQLLLFNPRTQLYYVYIPFTSTKTLNHLLEIERNINSPLLEVKEMIGTSINSKQRIELFELRDNRWVSSQSNQDNFNLFKFLDEENELISPYLLHYLLILILCLLAFDQGIKYRILKI